MPGAPTYYITKADDGTNVYHCLACEQQGQEHHASDEVLFIAHQEHRHSGAMIEDTDASAKAQSDHPQGGPPGQTGEHPEHPHGGPPGQTGDHPQGGPPGQDKPEEPDEGEPHPEHPIVDPDAPYPEQHPEATKP